MTNSFNIVKRRHKRSHGSHGHTVTSVTSHKGDGPFCEIFMFSFLEIQKKEVSLQSQT